MQCVGTRSAGTLRLSLRAGAPAQAAGALLADRGGGVVPGSTVASLHRGCRNSDVFKRTVRGRFSTSDPSRTERRNGARVGGHSGTRASLLGAIRAGARANRRGKREAPRNTIGQFVVRSDPGPRY